MLGGDGEANLGDILQGTVGTSNNFHLDMGFITETAKFAEGDATAAKVFRTICKVFSVVDAGALGLPGEAEIKIGETNAFGCGDTVKCSELDEVKLHSSFHSHTFSEKC